MIELVFTRLHAGGKFDKGKGGAYSFSGRPAWRRCQRHQCLATRLEATSYREGQVARLVFSAGDVVEPLVTQPIRRRPQARHHGARLARCQVLRVEQSAHG